MIHYIVDNMTKEEVYLLNQSTLAMDGIYNDTLKLLEHEKGKGDVRASSHYALGLLLRNQSGDFKRACDIISRVVELQFDDPEEIYHGTYRVTHDAPHPPQGNLPWKKFSPGWAYFLDTTFEKVREEFVNVIQAEAEENIGYEKINKIKNCFSEAVDRVLPRVWNSYDPNWREFIASTFAVILDHFEGILPEELVNLMDLSVKKAVGASIDRYFSDAIPMNTNILLMHIFITGYFGERYSNEQWVEHAHTEAQKIYDEYMEYKSFAEFNSSTYYGVDLMTLGLWRKYLKSDKLKSMGIELEDCLWENIAQFYNPNLENICGPFARCYEMDITEHSSIGTFIYMALGEEYRHLAEENTETSHNPLIALVGSNMPEKVKPCFISHKKDRQIEKKFRELCERGKPGENRTVCTATAWIEESIMLGALYGSKNTSGQLHTVTIFWKSEEGNVYSIRMVRREVGGHWSKHLRGITCNAKAQKDQIVAEVSFDINENIELLFEINGKDLDVNQISPQMWRLPGLTFHVNASTPQPSVSLCNGKLEVVYLYEAENPSTRNMNFEISIKR